MARILVIEDEVDNRENILDILTLESYEVMGAVDGMDGLKKIAEFKPDLILCDIMIPKLNGYGVLLELQAHPEYSMIPFVFLTAKTAHSDIRYGMNLGADDYLIKPFTTHELLEMVRKRLELKALRQRHYGELLEQFRRNTINYTLPHELRTPLTSIIGYSVMMLEDFHHFDSRQLLEMIQAIHRAGQRLQRLVENYLLYAQLDLMASDTQRLQLLRQMRTQETSLVIRASAEEKAAAYDRQHDLRLELDSAEARIFHDDLKKIVEELVDNAFKFSEGGTAVIVESGLQDGSFILRVTNSGRGMTREQIEQIGAYMQFDRLLHEQQGLGLGLSIGRQLVQLYQGDLVIASQPQAETTVTVTLPA